MVPGGGVSGLGRMVPGGGFSGSGVGFGHLVLSGVGAPLGIRGVDVGQSPKSISRISGGIHARSGDSRMWSTDSVIHALGCFSQLLRVKSRVENLVLFALLALGAPLHVRVHLEGVRFRISDFGSRRRI